MAHLNKNIKKIIILVVLLFLSLHIYWFFSSVIKSADFKYIDDEATTRLLLTAGYKYKFDVPQLVWVFWFGSEMSKTRNQSISEMSSIFKLPVNLITEKT
jgi:hypothetical protein